MRRMLWALGLALLALVAEPVIPARADSITIVTLDETWYTGSAYDDLTCVDGPIYLLYNNEGLEGESGGWARFDTTAIPDDSIITGVALHFYIDAFDEEFGPYVDYNAMEHDPVQASCAQRWAEITSGTTYRNNAVLSGTGWWYAELGSVAAQDMQDQLADDWFAVGFEHDDNGAYWAYVQGHDDAHPPYLVVTYRDNVPPEPDLYTVTGIPSILPLGQSFTVQVTAENDGGPAPTGKINASVLYSDGTDTLTLDAASASWAEALTLYDPGEGPLYTAQCTVLSGGAPDHVVEASETLWDEGERQALSFRVTPQKAGTVWVRTRATMAGEGTCTWYNDHSVSSAATDTDPQGWETARFAVTVNAPPALTFVQPASNRTLTQGETLLLQWTDSDPDNNAVIGLAYDRDSSPTNGSGHTWIVQGLQEDPDGSSDQYTWATGAVPLGTYYLWARIIDGINPTAHTVAAGRITIVEPPGPPELAYLRHTLDDDASGDSQGNGDGLAACGEQVELYVTLRNQGESTAKGVSVALSENFPYLSWLYNTTSSYPDIIASGMAVNNNDFDLKIASNTPDGHVIHFNLTATALNGGPWYATFDVPVTCETNSAPSTPTAPSPPDGATEQVANVDLSWTGGDPDAGDTVTYDVFLEAEDSTPDVLICQDVAVPACDPGLLEPGHAYAWYVVATDSHGASTSGEVWDFYTACPLPGSVHLTTPTNGVATCDPAPGLAWEPVTGALSYTLEIATDATFSTPLLVTSTAASSYQPEQPLSVGSHVWHVRAHTNCSAGPWSPPWQFTILSLPTAPLLHTPEHGSTLSDTLPAFAWSAVEGAHAYDLHVDTTAEFTAPVVSLMTLDTAYSTTAPLLQGTTYHWRARAANDCGSGPWSAAWVFTTPSEAPPVTPPSLLYLPVVLR